MIALQGYYNDGRLELAGEAPARTASVLVIFPKEYPGDQTLEDDWRPFERFTGSISRVIDEKTELEKGLKEKREGRALSHDKIAFNFINSALDKNG